MNAILIDANRKQVRAVQQNDIEDMYRLIGCDTFDRCDLGSGVDCYFDDEGLLKEAHIDRDGTKHNMHGFTFPGFSQPIMGNGLIVGHDEEGNTINAPVTVEQVEAVVSFVEYDNPKDRPQPHIEFIPFQ